MVRVNQCCLQCCVTGWYLYNAVNFLQNPHKGHSIAHPWGWEDMGVFRSLTLSIWFTCPSGTWFWRFTCPVKIFTCPANICTSPLKLLYIAGEISTCCDWKITCPVGHITTKIYVPWDKIYVPWDKIYMPGACGHTFISSPGFVISNPPLHSPTITAVMYTISCYIRPCYNCTQLHTDHLLRRLKCYCIAWYLFDAWLCKQVKYHITGSLYMYFFVILRIFLYPFSVQCQGHFVSFLSVLIVLTHCGLVMP